MSRNILINQNHVVILVDKVLSHIDSLKNAKIVRLTVILESGSTF
jgi:hypothetical protein